MIHNILLFLIIFCSINVSFCSKSSYVSSALYDILIDDVKVPISEEIRKSSTENSKIPYKHSGKAMPVFIDGKPQKSASHMIPLLIGERSLKFAGNGIT